MPGTPLADPDFYKLTPDVRVKVMQRFDPQFASLPENSQMDVVTRMESKYGGAAPQPDEAPPKRMDLLTGQPSESAFPKLSPVDLAIGAAKEVPTLVGGALKLVGAKDTGTAIQNFGAPSNEDQAIGHGAAEGASYMLPEALLPSVFNKARAISAAKGLLGERLGAFLGSTIPEAVSAGGMSAVNEGSLDKNAAENALFGGAMGGASAGARWFLGPHSEGVAESQFRKVFRPGAGKSGTAFDTKVLPYLKENPPPVTGDAGLANWLNTGRASANADLEAVKAANKGRMIDTAPIVSSLEATKGSAPLAAPSTGVPLMSEQSIPQDVIDKIKAMADAAAPGTPQEKLLHQYWAEAAQKNQRLAELLGAKANVPKATEVPFEDVMALKQSLGSKFPLETRDIRNKAYAPVAQALEDQAIPAPSGATLTDANARVTALTNAKRYLDRAANTRDTSAGFMGKARAIAGLTGLAGAGFGHPYAVAMTAPYLINKLTSSTAYRLLDADARLALAKAIQSKQYDVAERILGTSLEAAMGAKGSEEQ